MSRSGYYYSPYIPPIYPNSGNIVYTIPPPNFNGAMNFHRPVPQPPPAPVRQNKALLILDPTTLKPIEIPPSSSSGASASASASAAAAAAAAAAPAAAIPVGQNLTNALPLVPPTTSTVSSKLSSTTNVAPSPAPTAGLSLLPVKTAEGPFPSQAPVSAQAPVLAPALAPIPASSQSHAPLSSSTYVVSEAQAPMKGTALLATPPSQPSLLAKPPALMTSSHSFPNPTSATLPMPIITPVAHSLPSPVPTAPPSTQTIDGMDVKPKLAESESTNAPKSLLFILYISPFMDHFHYYSIPVKMLCSLSPPGSLSPPPTPPPSPAPEYKCYFLHGFQHVCDATPTLFFHPFFFPCQFVCFSSLFSPNQRLLFFFALFPSFFSIPNLMPFLFLAPSYPFSRVTYPLYFLFDF